MAFWSIVGSDYHVCCVCGVIARLEKQPSNFPFEVRPCVLRIASILMPSTPHTSRQPNMIPGILLYIHGGDGR